MRHTTATHLRLAVISSVVIARCSLPASAADPRRQAPRPDPVVPLTGRAWTHAAAVLEATTRQPVSRAFDALTRQLLAHLNAPARRALGRAGSRWVHRKTIPYYPFTVNGGRAQASTFELVEQDRAPRIRFFGRPDRSAFAEWFRPLRNPTLSASTFAADAMQAVEQRLAGIAVRGSPLTTDDLARVLLALKRERHWPASLIVGDAVADFASLVTEPGPVMPAPGAEPTPAYFAWIAEQDTALARTDLTAVPFHRPDVRYPWLDAINEYFRARKAEILERLSDETMLYIGAGPNNLVRIATEINASRSPADFRRQIVLVEGESTVGGTLAHAEVAMNSPNTNDVRLKIADANKGKANLLPGAPHYEPVDPKHIVQLPRPAHEPQQLHQDLTSGRVAELIAVEHGPETAARLGSPDGLFLGHEYVPRGKTPPIQPGDPSPWHASPRSGLAIGLPVTTGILTLGVDVLVDAPAQVRLHRGNPRSTVSVAGRSIRPRQVVAAVGGRAVAPGVSKRAQALFAEENARAAALPGLSGARLLSADVYLRKLARLLRSVQLAQGHEAALADYNSFFGPGRKIVVVGAQHTGLVCLEYPLGGVRLPLMDDWRGQVASSGPDLRTFPRGEAELCLLGIPREAMTRWGDRRPGAELGGFHKHGTRAGGTKDLWGETITPHEMFNNRYSGVDESGFVQYFEGGQPTSRMGVITALEFGHVSGTDGRATDLTVRPDGRVGISWKGEDQAGVAQSAAIIADAAIIAAGQGDALSRLVTADATVTRQVLHSAPYLYLFNHKEVFPRMHSQEVPFGARLHVGNDSERVPTNVILAGPGAKIPAEAWLAPGEEAGMMVQGITTSPESLELNTSAAVAAALAAAADR